MESHLNRIFQYAYFVEDLESAAHDWAQISQAGPFFVAPHHNTEQFDYRGTAVQADVSYAFGYAGACQIQLIQQHDDKHSIYRDMYPAGSFGFHHIAMLVDDYAVEKQRLLDQGVEKSCELYADGVWASYFDTRSAIGCYTELHSITDRILATFDRWKNAHDHWDGRSQVIIGHRSGS